MNDRGPNNPTAKLQAITPHGPQVFPSEAFACPNCGQMLGATVRVCVACKKPIDPGQIKPMVVELLPKRPQTGRPTNRVFFPWSLFFALFAVRALVIGGIVVLRHWNWSKAGLLLNTVDLITAALVFYDASRKHISKALRWALGSLFLWVVFFPWYLARRRELQKPCPLVEAEASPLVRGLAFLLFLFFVLGVLLVITQKFPK
jgi:hypothetical protein